MENLQLNIKPADRVSCVEEYYFSKKLKQIAQMNAQGMDIINLGVGSPDLPPSQSTLDALHEESIKGNANGYQPYIGVPEFRQAYSKWYKKWYNVDLNPNSEIQPLIGSKEGIMHITLAFVNKGDKVLVPNPGYPTYSSVSKLAEAEVLTYNLTDENGWEPDFEEIEKMDLKGVKLMWVNYPNMPTGKDSSPELFRKLIAFGKKHGIVIVNDNPYSFILNDKPMSILSFEGAKDICIELNSMSKSHNMPGWRIGVACANPQFIEWILRVKSNVDSGIYKPLQMAAVKALENNEEWHKANNAVYRNRRNKAEELMNLLGCEFDEKQTGLFLWGKIPSKYNSVEEFTEDILQNARVFITPGMIFGSNGNRFIRISLCATEEVFDKAIKRIKENIKL